MKLLHEQNRGRYEAPNLSKVTAPLKKHEGIIFDIMRYAIHDGPGVRTTIFMKGCPLQCWWCHNPEGISSTNDLAYFDYKCIGCKTCVNVCPTKAITFNRDKHFIDRNTCTKCGVCADTCPTGALKIIGRKISLEDLMATIERDIILYDTSGGGVTFSGGEPLYQPLFLKEALKECKDRKIHVALDTSGYAHPEVFKSIAEHVDLFLYDLKLLDDFNHRKYTGVSNKLIIENLTYLVEIGRGKDVIIRFPVIPKITDTDENVGKLVDLLQKLKGVAEVDLLPFHDISEKYMRIGKEYLMPIHSAPSEERLAYIREKLEAIGLRVKIGG
jgi:pyruvate formate lyase activating enzyme